MTTATITATETTLYYDPTEDTTPEGVDPKLWAAFEEGRISLRKARQLGIV